MHNNKTDIPKQQMTLMDLNLIDAFLFDVITEDTENAKKIAKIIIERTTSDNAVDKELLELQDMIGSIKNKKEVGERYMTLQEMINYEKRDSFQDGLAQGIRGFIRFCLSLHLSKEDAKKAILEQFDLTDAQAQNYLDLYWSENPDPNL